MATRLFRIATSEPKFSKLKRLTRRCRRLFRPSCRTRNGTYRSRSATSRTTWSAKHLNVCASQWPNRRRSLTPPRSFKCATLYNQSAKTTKTSRKKSQTKSCSARSAKWMTLGTLPYRCASFQQQSQNSKWRPIHTSLRSQGPLGCVEIQR